MEINKLYCHYSNFPKMILALKFQLWAVLMMLLVFSSLHLRSQDIHFSQFSTTPLSINPALTGIYEGTHRVSMNNRMQWRAVTVPYLTFSASGEVHLMIREFQQDMISVGVNMYRDMAGDSKFGTTQFNLYASYIKAIDKKNTHILSVGMQNGVAQRSFSSDALKFDSQYDGYQYNASLNNKETFAKTSFFYFDLGLGANWRYQKRKTQTVNTGFSISHLNKPMQSVFENNTIQLDQKLIFYSMANVEVMRGIYINPALLFEKQGKFKELIMGTQVKFVKNFLPKDFFATNLGVYVRTSDAAIISLGIDRVSTYYGVSYDVNFSDLKVASGLRGGLEIAIVHKLSKSKSVRMRSIPCPIF